MTASSLQSPVDGAPATITIEGSIVRKKRRYEWMVFAVKHDENEVSETVFCHQREEETLASCYLGAIVRVKGTRGRAADREGVVAVSVDLVQCAPVPDAIQYVMQGILDGRFPDWTLPISKKQVQEIEKLEFRERRLAIAKIVRQLQGKDELERDPRKRRPHTKLQDLELLDAVESRGLISGAADNQKGWRLQTIQSRPLNGDSESTVVDRHSETLNFFTENPVESTRRQEYLLGKKQPQVQWMMERIRDLNRKPKHILDVGGGRGDLSIALAMHVSAKVTVVEKNESSLLAGREHAKNLGCGDKMTFVHADFFDFVQVFEVSKDDTPPIDLVVALHACGDLSDLALAFAQQLRCSFVICPCCYTKRYIHSFSPSWHSLVKNAEERVVMSRLAELNERPHISKRAMRVINSMRLHCVQTQSDGATQNLKLTLEQYESQSSLRNLVLIRDCL
jgi:hypothetical protein